MPVSRQEPPKTPGFGAARGRILVSVVTSGGRTIKNTWVWSLPRPHPPECWRKRTPRGRGTPEGANRGLRGNRATPLSKTSVSHGPQQDSMKRGLGNAGPDRVRVREWRSRPKEWPRRKNGISLPHEEYRQKHMPKCSNRWFWTCFGVISQTSLFTGRKTQNHPKVGLGLEKWKGHPSEPLVF